MSYVQTVLRPDEHILVTTDPADRAADEEGPV